jgi:TrmH family RNA methyltransferase
MAAAGPQHPRVRQFLAIKNNRTPNRGRAAAIEGVWALRHAVRAAAQIDAVFICPELLRGDEAYALARASPCFRVSERVLRRLVDRDGPDGVAAIARVPPAGLDDIDLSPHARLVVLDGLELPGNVGTIIRCADAVGAAAVVLTGRRVRVTHPRVLHASMGTVFFVPIVEADATAVVRWMQERHVRTIGAEPAAAEPYRAVDARGRVAFVFGSERYGLSPEWQDALDARVSIPMLGVADSLNVGHAAAVLLYHALAQQRA